MKPSISDVTKILENYPSVKPIHWAIYMYLLGQSSEEEVAISVPSKNLKKAIGISGTSIIAQALDELQYIGILEVQRANGGKNKYTIKHTFTPYLAEPKIQNHISILCGSYIKPDKILMWFALNQISILCGYPEKPDKILMWFQIKSNSKKRAIPYSLIYINNIDSISNLNTSILYKDTKLKLEPDQKFLKQKPAPPEQADTGVPIPFRSSRWSHDRAELKAEVLRRLGDTRLKYAYIDQYIDEVAAWKEPDKKTFKKMPDWPGIVVQFIKSAEKAKQLVLDPKHNINTNGSHVARNSSQEPTGQRARRILNRFN
jgi:hypothetical protein